MSDGDGDNYMTESAKESEAEEYVHVSPEDPLGGVDVIPDSADGVDLASGEDVTVVEKFVRIGPNSKWILTLPDDTDYETATRFADRVQDWWDNNNGLDFPIMVIGGAKGMGIRLVRVNEDEIGPELVDCGAEHCPGHVVGDGERCCEDLYCDCEPNCGCEEGKKCDCGKEPDGDFAG